jgi:hypothetical protein
VKSRLCTIALISVSFVFAASGLAKNLSQASAGNLKGTSVSTHATGTFEVKLTPQTSSDAAQDANLGRLTIDKQFHGAIEGTSKGQMLTAGTSVKGSAGYVAMEQVSGTLDGHAGSFILQHTATMNRGVPQLSITVVPDSGTGELAGLSGKMNIIISEGKHSYDFEYAISKTP